MTDYLIITSSGGGGHKSASDALVQHALEKDPDKQGKVIDVMRSGCSYGTFLGRKCTHAWDKAQMRGDTTRQQELFHLQVLAEVFFFIGTFFTILHQLLKAETLPEKIICTQPLHLFAITAAAKMANLVHSTKERKITKIDLYLTDLPTKKATHYLGALSRLHATSRKGFKMLQVHAPEPLHTEFWKNHTHLKPEQIQIEPLPINAAYDKATAFLPLPGMAAKCTIQQFTPTEASEMKQLGFEKGEFPIASQDQVGLLMLGSNPEKGAILNYVDGIIEAAKKGSLENQGRDFYFFIACGSQEQNGSSDRVSDESLYKAVCKKVAEAKLPSQLKIVPFIGQPIAPIFARSNLSITRSGGITSAEILALKKRFGDDKRVLIHSPLKTTPEKSTETERHQLLLKKIPLWENGNAEFLIKSPTVGAEIVNPSSAKEEFDAFFAAKSFSKQP